MFVTIIRLVEVPYTDKNEGVSSTVMGQVIRLLPQCKLTNVDVTGTVDLTDLTRFVSAKFKVPIKTLYTRNKNAFEAMHTLESLKGGNKAASTLYSIHFLKGFDPTPKNRLVRKNFTDFTQFEDEALSIARFIKRYLETLENRRAVPVVHPGFLKQMFPENIPEQATPLIDLLLEVETKILPGMVHTTHPQMRSYFPIGTNGPSILADFLTGGINSLLGTWAMSPSGVEFEMLVLEWYGKLMGLPKNLLPLTRGLDGGACMASTTTESIFWAVCVARDLVLRRRSESATQKYEVYSKLVAYTSEESHYCHEKSFRLAGITFRKLPTSEKGTLKATDLENAIKKDLDNGMIPFFLSATFCTTGIVAVDNVEELGLVAKSYDMWFHYDMAYGGQMLIVPEMRKDIKGLEYVSSLNVAPHKGFASFDLVCVYTSRFKDFSSCFSFNPGYIKHTHPENRAAVNYKDTGLGITRPFRGIKLYFVLRMFGIDKLRNLIRCHCSLAKYAGSLLKKREEFEVLAVRMGVVLFRLKGDNQTNLKLIDLLNRTGDLQIVSHNFKGQVILRFVVGKINETKANVEKGVEIIGEHASKLYNENYRDYMLRQIDTEVPAIRDEIYE